MIKSGEEYWSNKSIPYTKYNHNIMNAGQFGGSIYYPKDFDKSDPNIIYFSNTLNHIPMFSRLSDEDKLATISKYKDVVNNLSNPVLKGEELERLRKLEMQVRGEEPTFLDNIGEKIRTLGYHYEDLPAVVRYGIPGLAGIGLTAAAFNKYKKNQRGI